MDEKRCRKCGRLLPLSAFWEDKSNHQDGHRSTCRECLNRKRKDDLLYGERERERNRNRDRTEYFKEWSSTEKGKESIRKKGSKYRNKNPEKVRAKKILNDAKSKGVIKELPCFACGSTEQLEAHHPSYAEPLAVVWLCHKCHMRTHREFRELLRNENKELEK